MSRREREARIRAAAPKREAYLKAQAAGQTGGASGSGKGGRGTTLLMIGGIVLAAAAAVTYVLVIRPWLDDRQLRGQSGRPVGALFGDGVVALVDAVDVEHEDREDIRRNRRIARTRVTVLDLASGARVAQHLFDGEGGCAEAGAGRLWCNFGRLAVHDARTFAPIARADELLARAQLGRPLPDRWRVIDGVAVQALADGRAAELDAVALTARRAKSLPAELRADRLTGQGPRAGWLPLAPACAPAGALAGAREGLSAGGVTWTLEDRGGRMAVRRLGGPAPTDDFLSPTLLAAVEGAPLVVHHASLEPGRDRTMVSRLADDGAAAWTVELDGACTAWKLVGTELVVVTDRPGTRALALDAVSGAVRWPSHARARPVERPEPPPPPATP